ncbi:MAG: nickel-responsive transcriptional regulator NikR [Candidatus Bipolaricaulaceae bacterium]
MGTVRFGVSMDSALLARFDQQVVQGRYANRSEAIRDLVRGELVRRAWQSGEVVVGVIALVYDHHVRGLEARLTDLQHREHAHVLSSMHVHLDHDYCLEVIAVKGPGDRVSDLAATLIGLRGVRHGRLTATAAGGVFG